MGVKAADLSRWVLLSTKAELGDLLKVPKKMGDSCCTKSSGQCSPCGSGCVSNEISDVQGTSELDGAIGHRVRQSPFLELYRIRRRCSGATNNQPKADRPEVGAHLSGPFPIVCPIEDGNVGGDGGGCLV